VNHSVAFKFRNDHSIVCGVHGDFEFAAGSRCHQVNVAVVRNALAVSDASAKIIKEMVFHGVSPDAAVHADWRSADGIRCPRKRACTLAEMEKRSQRSR